MEDSALVGLLCAQIARSVRGYYIELSCVVWSFQVTYAQPPGSSTKPVEGNRDRPAQAEGGHEPANPEGKENTPQAQAQGQAQAQAQAPSSARVLYSARHGRKHGQVREQHYRQGASAV